jgi:uncharacterized protein (DUF433 family)
MTMELKHHEFSKITINPEVCTGKLCIRDIRFPVTTLIGYLAGGMTIEELLEDFPFLEKRIFLKLLLLKIKISNEK